MTDSYDRELIARMLEMEDGTYTSEAITEQIRLLREAGSGEQSAAPVAVDDAMKQRAGIYCIQAKLPITSGEMIGLLEAALAQPKPEEGGLEAPTTREGGDLRVTTGDHDARAKKLRAYAKLAALAELQSRADPATWREEVARTGEAIAALAQPKPDEDG